MSEYVPEHLPCASCGSTDLWAWYPDPTRQTIDAWLDENDEVRYDYSGVTDSGDDAGPDESYTCGGCGTVTETIEELVGRPRPPLLGRSLSEWDALGLLFAGEERPEPDQAFPSGADFIEAVVSHYGFTRASYVRYCELRREQDRIAGRTVTVKITNDYADGHHSEREVDVTAPGDRDLDEWFDAVVYQHTGDGHGEPGLGSCYTATITAAADQQLVGREYEWAD